MTRTRLRALSVALVAALGADPAAAVGLLGQGKKVVAGGVVVAGAAKAKGKKDRGGTSGAAPRSGSTKLLNSWDVSGFDPATDVLAYGNYSGDGGGGAHCYAMSFLVYQFHRKTTFTTTAGQWRADRAKVYQETDRLVPLRVVRADGSNYGAYSARFLASWLTGPGGSDADTIELGDFAGLHALSSTDGGEAMTKKMATSIQGNWSQIRASGTRVVGTVIGSLWNGQERNSGVARDIRNSIRDDDLPVLISMHKRAEVGGHVVVVHRVEMYSDRWELVCYDPNRPPSGGSAQLMRIRVWDDNGQFECIDPSDGTVFYDYTFITTLNPLDSGTRSRARSAFHGALSE